MATVSTNRDGGPPASNEPQPSGQFSIEDLIHFW